MISTTTEQFIWQTNIGEDDIAKVKALVAKTGVFNAEEINIAAELVEESLHLPADKAYQFLKVSIPSGQLIAYTCYGRIPFTDERYDLYWIVTDPAHQGSGLSQTLYQKTESLIRQQGGQIIYAETSGTKAYIRAQQFYLKQGFQLAARLPDFFRKADDKLIFSKCI